MTNDGTDRRQQAFRKWVNASLDREGHESKQWEVCFQFLLLGESRDRAFSSSFTSGGASSWDSEPDLPWCIAWSSELIVERDGALRQVQILRADFQDVLWDVLSERGLTTEAG